MSNKKSLVKSLQILLPDEMSGDKKGLLSNWIHIAMNKKCWDHKIEKLKKPGVNIPEPSSTDQNRDNYNHNTPQSPPPPSPHDTVVGEIQQPPLWDLLSKYLAWNQMQVKEK